MSAAGDGGRWSAQPGGKAQRKRARGKNDPLAHQAPELAAAGSPLRHGYAAGVPPFHCGPARTPQLGQRRLTPPLQTGRSAKGAPHLWRRRPTGRARGRSAARPQRTSASFDCGQAGIGAGTEQLTARALGVTLASRPCCCSKQAHAPTRPARARSPGRGPLGGRHAPARSRGAVVRLGGGSGQARGGRCSAASSRQNCIHSLVEVRSAAAACSLGSLPPLPPARTSRGPADPAAVGSPGTALTWPGASCRAARRLGARKRPPPPRQRKARPFFSAARRSPAGADGGLRGLLRRRAAAGQARTTVQCLGRCRGGEGQRGGPRRFFHPRSHPDSRPRLCLVGRSTSAVVAGATRPAPPAQRAHAASGAALACRSFAKARPAWRSTAFASMRPRCAGPRPSVGRGRSSSAATPPLRQVTFARWRGRERRARWRRNWGTRAGAV